MQGSVKSEPRRMMSQDSKATTLYVVQSSWSHISADGIALYDGFQKFRMGFSPCCSATSATDGKDAMTQRRNDSLASCYTKSAELLAVLTALMQWYPANRYYSPHTAMSAEPRVP